MKIEQAAFINLVALARADGQITSPEHSFLKSQQEVLGISKEFADKILEQEELKPLDVEGAPSDKLHIFKIMLRVAYADGLVSGPEKKLLHRVARTLGIGKIPLGALHWEVRRELGIKKKLRLSQWAILLVLLVSALLIWFFTNRADQQLDEARINLAQLKKQLGAERAQADEILSRIRKSQAKTAENELKLSLRLKEMEEENKKAEALTKAQQVQMEQLKNKLTQVKNCNAAFKEIEKEYNQSILLIFISYDLVLSKNRINRGSMGTGFFVSSLGHIVTNKHVVQPWKFGAEDRMLLNSGYSVDPKSVMIAAWIAGSEVKTKSGHLNIDRAFCTKKNSLALYKATKDTFVKQTRRLDTGGVFTGDFHTHNEGDLAILKAKYSFPANALPLASATGDLEKLDPVMVLGFPTGVNILETEKAETSPSLGEVRKIEKSIMVTAPIFPGNSGGPLINHEGRIVGVAAGIYGDATLGTCIPSEHILHLLPEASDLIRDSSKKKHRAALDDLRLALQRSQDEKERKAILALMTPLESLRDQQINDAKAIKEAGARKQALKKILEQFGPQWAKEAKELLMADP